MVQWRWEKQQIYFFNLEKKHKTNTIGQLKLNENESITSDKDILKECRRFFSELYTQKET